MILVFVLLLFIMMVMINKGLKEGYVVAVAPGGAAARADARTYTGPGDALRGPVAPARKRVKRTRPKTVVVWYNPTTWRWWW